MTMTLSTPAWCTSCDDDSSATIAAAAWPADTAEVRALIEEYVDWLSSAAGAHPADVQPGFLDEIAQLEQWYTPPSGRMVIARRRGEIVGTAGVHLLSPDDAELKRVYVRPSARGENLGRRLTDAAISAARELGAQRLLLETSPHFMPAAYRIYLERGFRPTASYSDLDYDGALPMERNLNTVPETLSLGTPHTQLEQLASLKSTAGPPRANAYIRRDRSR